MTTYLTIITTILVLTQIIRLVQNAIQLKSSHQIDEANIEIMKIYKKIEDFIDKE